MGLEMHYEGDPISQPNTCCRYVGYKENKFKVKGIWNVLSLRVKKFAENILPAKPNGFYTSQINLTDICSFSSGNFLIYQLDAGRPFDFGCLPLKIYQI